MKINLANKRSKQGINNLLTDQVGAIAKYDYAKSNPLICNHADYTPNSHANKVPDAEQAAKPTPKPRDVHQDILDIEVTQAQTKTQAQPSTLARLRMTERCRNCGELIGKNDRYCWNCNSQAINQPLNQGGLEQTIIIKFFTTLFIIAGIIVLVPILFFMHWGLSLLL